MTHAPSSDRVTYLGHATVLLEIGGSRILTDPILRNRLAHLRRRGPAPELDGLTLDAILISHLHLDHLDLPSLRRLPLDTPVVVSGGGGRLLARAGFSAVEEVVPGDTLRVGAVSITAVEAVHDGRRWPFGEGAGSLGFVVGGSSRTYFAGDTDVFPAMSGLGALDLALLPVWGWGPTWGTGTWAPPRPRAPWPCCARGSPCRSTGGRSTRSASGATGHTSSPSPRAPSRASPRSSRPPSRFASSSRDRR